MKLPFNPLRHAVLSTSLATLLLAVLPAGELVAGNKVWDGEGAPDGNWLTGANWDLNTAPLANDVLFFAGSAQTLSTNNFTSGTAFKGISFNSGASSFTVSGNGLVLTNGSPGISNVLTAGSISNFSANAQTISLPLTISAGQHYITTVAGSGQLNLNGPITRDPHATISFTNIGGAINVTGSGLTTNGLNNILGGGAVFGGANAVTWATLDGSSNVIGLPLASYTTVAGGTAIASNPVSNVRITPQSATASSLAATTTDLNSLVYAGTAGNQILNIAAGQVLRLGAGGIMNVVPALGGTARIFTVGQTAGQGFLTAGGPIADNPGDLFLIDTPISAAGGNNLVVNASITNNGSGAVALHVLGYVQFNSVVSTFSGGTFINQGRVQSGGVNNFGTGPVYIFNGGHLFLNVGGGTWTNDFYIAGFGTPESGGNGAIRMGGSRTISGTVTLMELAATGNGTISGKITGPGGLIVGSGTGNGSGTLTLGGAANNDYAGDTTINSTNVSGANTIATTTANKMPHGSGKGNLILNALSGTVTATLNVNATTQIINGLSNTAVSPGNNFVTGGAGGLLVVGDNDTSSTFAGTIQGAMGLAKTGAGTLTLTGGNGYTGPTTVSNGVLALGPAGSIGSSTPIAVVNGGTLDVSQPGVPLFVNFGATVGGNGAITGSVSAASSSFINAALFGGGNPLTFKNDLTLNGDGSFGVSNVFHLSGSPAGPNSSIDVAGTLTINGSNTIVVTGFTGLASGTYTLITYGAESLGAGAGWNLAGFSTDGRQTASIVDTGTGQINLVITGSAADLTWVGDGAGNLWDAGTTNWLNAGNPDRFFNNDSVLFNDSGSQSPAVNVTGSLQAAIVEVDASGNYTFSGSGDVTANSLIKDNTGTLTIENANNFGTVTIANGTLQVGNDTLTGSLGTGNVTNNGALVLRRSDDIAVSNVISGSGALAQYGAGVATLGGANTFTGPTTITNGTLKISGAANGISSLGAIPGGAVTITNGGTLDVGGSTVGNIVFTNTGGTAKQFYVAGAGVGGNGAIVNSGIVNQQGAFQKITLTADAIFGGPTRWDMRNGTPGPLLDLAGYKVTKLSGNLVALVGAAVTSGDLQIDGGTLSIETSSAVNGTGTITVNPAGTLGHFRTWSGAITRNIVVNGGTINNLSTSGGGSTNDAPISLIADAFVSSTAGSDLYLNGVISSAGSFGFSKLGTGNVVLTNVNTYSGNTLLNGGTLTVADAGSIASSAQIDMNSSTLDVSRRNGAFTLTPNTLTANNSTLVFTNTAPAGIGTLNLNDSTIRLPVINGGTATILATNLNIGGSSNYATITVSIPRTQFQYPLIQYGALSGDPGIIGASNLVPAGFNGFISNNVANSTLDLVLTAGSAGEVLVWNGGNSAVNNNWSDPLNWNGVGLLPNNTLVFDGTAGLNNTNNTAAGAAYSGITFSAGSGAFALNGNPIVLNGNITNASANGQAILFGLSFGASRTIDGGTAGLILGGGLTNTLGAPGTTTLTLAGTGTLTNLLNSTTAPGGTNLVQLNSSTANWTLADNAVSTPIAGLPWALQVSSGTFNFGVGSSAPSLSSVSVNGIPGDFEIGRTANTIGTFNLNGGTLTTVARWNTGTASGATGIVNQVGGTFNIGQQFQGANGTGGFSFFNVSGGTNTVGGTLFVASRGTGTLTVSGSGTVNCGTLDVSRGVSGTASKGTVNLNGGTLAVNNVTDSSTTIGSSADFNFNGGTLKARQSSASFFTNGVLAIIATVKTGGAIIDTSGFNDGVVVPLIHDSGLGATADGGLTKLGAGTLTLSAANTYTGPTIINDGTLLISGSISTGAVTVAASGTLAGTGTVGGAVTVNGTIAPGTPTTTGTLTVQSDVTVTGTNAMKLDKANATNDVLAVTGTLTYGGTLSLTSLSGTLAAGDSFPLFSAGTYSGTFAQVEPATPGAGLLWDVSNLAVNGTLAIVSAGPTTNAQILSVVRVGGNIVIHGTNNNVPNTSFRYAVVTSTNLAEPVTNWTGIATNNFNPDGTFDFTNAITSQPRLFYDVLAVP